MNIRIVRVAFDCEDEDIDPPLKIFTLQQPFSFRTSPCDASLGAIHKVEWVFHFLFPGGCVE